MALTLTSATPAQVPFIPGGTQSTGQPTIYAVLTASHQLSGVITQ